MDHFAGLDVSVKVISICIVDDTGKIVREVKVASEPEALLSVLKNPAYHIKRIGLEAGPLSQWLFGALAEAELPVVCVETRHMQAVLKAQINKTDRNDARGIAQMMRVGLYRPVHVKTLRSQKLRMLLTQSRHALTRLARQFRVHERHFVPQKDRSLFPSEHRNFAPDPVVMASALRAQTLHLAFPSGPQDARTTTIVLVKKFDGEDAIAPEMPKRLTQLAPGRQHAHRLGITDDHRPDGALGVLRLSVSIADAYLAPTANP